MIPTGHYERLSNIGPLNPLQATLVRSRGTWWLRYEDGHTEDTRHQAYGPNAYRKDIMEKIVTQN